MLNNIVSIELVVEDTEIMTGYDPPATNHFVRRFEMGRDSPKNAWFAVYRYKSGIADWIADCATIGVARMMANALARRFHYEVQENFPAGYKIERVERPLS
jgi:hypothetical protein